MQDLSYLRFDTPRKVPMGPIVHLGIQTFFSNKEIKESFHLSSIYLMKNSKFLDPYLPFKKQAVIHTN